MLKLPALLLALWCGVGYALNPPVPAPFKARHEPKPYPSKSNAVTNNQHRPSDQSSLPVTVIVKGPVTTEQTPVERQEARKEQDTEASNERWLKIFTGFLAFATGILVLVTWRLASHTKKLWNATKQLVADAGTTSKRQAEETKESLSLMDRQIKLEELRTNTLVKQKEIDRQQFFATHHPKIAVRELLLLVPTAIDKTAEVSFVIANRGSTAAKIVGSYFEFQVVEGGRFWPLKCEEGTNVVGDERIEPGSHIPWKCTSEISPGVYQNELTRQLQADPGPHCRFFLRGYVIYSDTTAYPISRRIAICRGFDFQRNRFRQGDDPDYEYQD